MRSELDTIRKELRETIAGLPPDELDWRPTDDMKSLRDLLLEIGTTEVVSARWLRDRSLLDWDEAWA
ncbi:hypothetical protein ACQ7B2_06630, partial [Escherichia coli]